jgi:hypothetical protein
VTVIEIDPKYSSQECSCCGYISPTNRDREKFLCEACGHLDDADFDASKVIAARGARVLASYLDAVLVDSQKQDGHFAQRGEPPHRKWPCKSTPMELSLGLPGEPGNQRPQTRKVEYIQLSLFEGMLSEDGRAPSDKNPTGF